MRLCRDNDPAEGRSDLACESVGALHFRPQLLGRDRNEAKSRSSPLRHTDRIDAGTDKAIRREHHDAVSEKDEKAIEKYFKIMGEIQMEMMDEELDKMTKNGKYVGRKEILEANRKNGKWVIENPNFGY